MYNKLDHVPCEQCQEIIEIYAGMEDFIPKTAPEEYLRRIIKQMYDCAKSEGKQC